MNIYGGRGGAECFSYTFRCIAAQHRMHKPSAQQTPLPPHVYRNEEKPKSGHLAARRVKPPTQTGKSGYANALRGLSTFLHAYIGAEETHPHLEESITGSTKTCTVRPFSRRTSHSANSSGEAPSSPSGGGLNMRRQHELSSCTIFRTPVTNFNVRFVVVVWKGMGFLAEFSRETGFPNPLLKHA